VECALKACAARKFREHEVPEKSFVNDFYTHRFDELVRISGCADILIERKRKDPQFKKNWETLDEWSEALRYNPKVTEEEARRMLAAVSDPLYGVLPCLKSLW
jgi:hypothetical protein